MITIPVPKKMVEKPQAIFVQCPSCGQRHMAQPSMAGTRAKCPCGQIVSIPSAVGQPRQASLTVLPDDDFGANLGSIPDDPLGPAALPASSACP